MKDRSNSFTYKAVLHETTLVMMNYARKDVFFILVAKTLEIILASTLTSEIGLQFSKRERSFTFLTLLIVSVTGII